MPVDPVDPTTWTSCVRRFIESIQQWPGTPPRPLFHATANGDFSEFDFDLCYGCVWMQPDRCEAYSMALGFADNKRGRLPTIYECAFSPQKVAAFEREEAIVQLGGLFCDQGRYQKLRAAARALLTRGFDGIVDCDGNSQDSVGQLSYGALSHSAVRIIKVHRLGSRDEGCAFEET